MPGKRRTPKGHAVLDEQAYRDYIDELAIPWESFRQAILSTTGVEIKDRQLERWYSGDTDTAKIETIRTVETTIETLRGKVRGCVCIRRDLGRRQQSALLDKEQTENLLELHEASVAYRMAQVVQDALADTGTFDEERFYERIKAALGESRKLCLSFNSKIVDNMFTFLEQSYSEKELKEDVELAVSIITQDGVSTYDKWLRLASLVAAKQKVHQQRLRDRLNGA